MKTLVLTFGTIIAFIAGSTLFIGCGSGSQNEAGSAAQHDMENPDHDHEAKRETMAATFACPMHPEVTGKEGDKCPECGMALAATDGKADRQAMASCPMHPEITGKEGDKCSECGMALVLADAGNDGHDHQH